MRLLLAMAGLGLALLLIGPLGGSDTALGQETITVTLGPGRDASQTGTATLTAQQQGSQVLVVINIQSGPAGAAQLAHIHEGSCPEVGAVAFPLSDVVNGTSTTTLNTTSFSLRDGNHNINVHKGTSAADAAVYVACGNIPAAPAAGVGVPGSGGLPPSDSGFAWSYVLIAVGALAALSGALTFALRRLR